MADIVSYKWKPVEPLPREHFFYASTKLQMLTVHWLEQREGIDVEEFIRRLQREWAIETGIIERVYSLDRGITETLIERGIDAALIPHDKSGKSPEHIASIINDHEEAVQGIFDFVKGDRILSTSYIKSLHALLMKNQDTYEAFNSLGRRVETKLLKGEYKKFPNNVKKSDGTMHEYCPPEQVASEMDRLVELHLKSEETTVSTDVRAAWLHHRFSQIHPFQDGNGRVARALATLVFIKAGLFPLAITNNDRDTYLTALEEADQGRLKELIDLFVYVLERSFRKAFVLADSTRHQQEIKEILTTANEKLRDRAPSENENWSELKSIAKGLWQLVEDRLKETSKDVKTTIGNDFDVSVESAMQDEGKEHWFRSQVSETAGKTGYSANIESYHSWSRMIIEGKRQAEILVSIHGISPRLYGFLGVSMCFYYRETSESGELPVTNVTPVSIYEYTFSDRHDPVELERDFAGWLHKGIVSALDAWSTGL